MQTKLKQCAGCAKESLIYKCVGRDRYCRNCAVKMNPPKRIPIRSEKRAKQERQYSVQSKLLKARVGECVAKLPGCTGYDETSLTVQHLRGRVGDLLLDERYHIVICLNCHIWVNEHPLESKELGLELSRLSI